MTFIKTGREKDFFMNPIGKIVDEFLSTEVNPFIDKNFVNRAPSANIVDKETEFEIQIMAPGRNKENFELSVDKNILTISDKTDYNAAADEKAKEKFAKKEFVVAPFKRSFNLSNKVNKDAITAKYENGILFVTVPKKAEVIKPAVKIEVA